LYLPLNHAVGVMQYAVMARHAHTE